MMHLITGGERSGKSRYAMELALKASDNPIYVATARKWDADFENRIKRHQTERDHRWQNEEVEKYVSAVDLANRIVVVDCITLWLTNFYADNKYDAEKTLVEIKAEFDKWQKLDCDWYIITNEIGMGVHAETAIGRKFVELQGWINQHIAACADSVTFMVSGLPMKVK